MKPRNLAERLVWYSLVGTYGFYAIGSLYILGAVLAWILLLDLAITWWQRPLQDVSEPRNETSVPMGVWIWILGMIVMEITLVMGHLDFNLETGLMIKSSIGWAKGWALLAVYPLVGTAKIRPQLLYRAACVIGLQSILLFPLLFLAYKANLPQSLFVSPLKAVGGPGPEFFELMLYEIDPSNGQPRWRLFAPWAPALGFVGNVYFFMALQEKNRLWRCFGIVGSILMCLVSVSRLALVSIVGVSFLVQLLSRLGRPLTLMALGVLSLLSGILAPTLSLFVETAAERFTQARADSSRVRSALGRIAVDRWWNEAVIWGHGTVEPGPHIVEFMPIGSHHTWFGLLFVKGIAGFLALAIPMLYSFFDLLLKAQSSSTARVSLAMLLILFLYTFGENLEILAYLYWPALLVIGMGLRESLTSHRDLEETQNA
jgi:hypothetical protein